MYHYPPPYYPPPPPTPQRYGDHFNTDVQSSDGAYEELEDVTLYPRIPEWLQGLDDGVRGKDGQNFAQFGAALVGAGYNRICDLQDEKLVTAKMLRKDCGIISGVAVNILRWARRDVSNIKDAERRRLRDLKRAPKRYV